MDEQICTAIVSMLARIGIKVDLNAQTKSKYFNKILAPNYDTDFYLLGWTPATYDAHNALYTLLGTRDGKRGEVNAGGYSNPTLDAVDREDRCRNGSGEAKCNDQSVDRDLAEGCANGSTASAGHRLGRKDRISNWRSQRIISFHTGTSR